MKSLSEQLETYYSHHNTSTNRLIHYIGIPAILFATLMLLNWFSIDIAGTIRISFTWFAVAAAAAYYFMLDVKLAGVTTVVMAIFALIATLVAGRTPNFGHVVLFVILFFGGWVGLFIGHGLEKTKPAFTKAISQMIVAPLFLVIELLKVTGFGSMFGISAGSKSKSSSDDE